MTKTIIALSVLTATLFLACKKTATIPERFDPVSMSNTNLKFINLSPDAPTVNFFTNGVKTTSATPTGTTATVVTGLAYAGFYPSVAAYTTLASGAIKVDVKVPDSSVVMPSAQLLTMSRNFDAAKFYTIALVDSVGSNPVKLSAVITEDDPTVLNPAKAYIRIANYISNGAINVEMTKTSSVAGDFPYTKTFTNVPAKTVLSFDSIAAGTGQVYKFIMRNAVTDARLDSIVGFAPSNTKKYSIYARGVIGVTGTNTRRPLISSYVNF